MSAARTPSPTHSLAAWSQGCPLRDVWPLPTGFCSSWGPTGRVPSWPCPDRRDLGKPPPAAPLTLGTCGRLHRQHQGRPALLLPAGHHHRTLQVLRRRAQHLPGRGPGCAVRMGALGPGVVYTPGQPAYPQRAFEPWGLWEVLAVPPTALILCPHPPGACRTACPACGCSEASSLTG